MRATTFLYSNPFSSIDVRAEGAAESWLEWRAEDAERGFAISEHVVSFKTSSDDDYEVTVVESDDEQVPDDCLVAVKVPLANPGAIVHIRGGYSDVDIPTAKTCRSVMFLELPGNRVLLRLSQIGGAQHPALHAYLPSRGPAF